MAYDNSGPIYSVLTGKSPCGAYGGVELDGSTVDGVALIASNCTAGSIGPYCRGGVIIQGGQDWCCFGPCVNNSDCENGNHCNNGTCCTKTCLRIQYGQAPGFQPYEGVGNCGPIPCPQDTYQCQNIICQSDNIWAPNFCFQGEWVEEDSYATYFYVSDCSKCHG